MIEGGREKGMEEVGAPEGTTFLIRNLFFNTPARAKFLKSPVTEAGYISSFIEQLALSHPEISFKYIQNRQTKLHTSGNNNRKEVIYQVYGREITRELLPVSYDDAYVAIEGFAAKPSVCRGNRNFENYYINGRYVKSRLLMKAIEDGYKPYMMQHKYPFTSLYITVNGEHLDVNVHPTKMEVRFDDQEQLYRSVYRAVAEALEQKELIPEMVLDEKQAVKEKREEEKRQREAFQKAPEPFERQRILREKKETERPVLSATTDKPMFPYRAEQEKKTEERRAEQLTLFDGKLLSKEAACRHRIIGQIFDTYWLVQFEEKLYIIDQHAAHEKVLYERILQELREKKITSQILSPP